jgi:hypothetical protein
MADSGKDLRDKIAAEAEHAEASRDAELPYRRRRPTRSPAYGLRLPHERIDQLRTLACVRSVEPSVLVRQWVIEHLEAADCGRDPNSERWERDFRATADHLRQLLDDRPRADTSQPSEDHAEGRIWSATEERRNARVHAGGGLGGGRRVAVPGRQSG